MSNLKLHIDLSKTWYEASASLWLLYEGKLPGFLTKK